MPLHPDFQKVRKAMIEKYGKQKGTEVYYKWVNKHGYDDTKPLSSQKSKANATGDAYDPLLELFEVAPDEDSDPEEEVEEPEHREVPISDGMDRLQAEDTALKETGVEKPTPHQQGIKDKDESVGGGNKDPSAHDKIPQQASKFVSVPMYKFTYTAAPKPGFEGKDGPILIKALVLEEGPNINGWRVKPKQFQSVADQYKAGRHLRINHSKNMEDVIGKSYNGFTLLGKDVPMYLGLSQVDGINPEGLYVAAEFEANPRDPQVRTNILHSYVETGSIGLDANAFCAECGKPVKADDEGRMEKTCRHLEAMVDLDDVDVKEYSYVAEPAFEHTKAYPSFSAAVNSLINRSSLSQSPAPPKQDMSATEQLKAEALANQKIEADAAKKPPAKDEDDGDADADAEALAAKYFSFYKKGMADAMKFRAEGEGEGEGDSDSKKSDADASAKPKTDQVALVAQNKESPKASKIDYADIAWHPTAYQLKDPMIREIFKAAAEHPNAPSSVRRFKGARWE